MVKGIKKPIFKIVKVPHVPQVQPVFRPVPVKKAEAIHYYDVDPAHVIRQFAKGGERSHAKLVLMTFYFSQSYFKYFIYYWKKIWEERNLDIEKYYDNFSLKPVRFHLRILLIYLSFHNCPLTEKQKEVIAKYRYLLKFPNLL